MASCPASERPPFLRPSLPLCSEDGKAIDSDHRPILERENDDDGPPPIPSPHRCSQFSLPPAPPTSRGTSFDEPLWIQNARSSSDLWLRGWWIEERFGTKSTPVAANTIHNAPYRDTMLNAELLWDDELDSCATSIRSSLCSNQSSPSDENVDQMLSSRESSTYSSCTFQSTEENQLTAQHRNFGTEDLGRLDEHKSPVNEGYPLRDFGNPIHTRLSTTTSPTVALGTKAGHACYIGCRTPAERTVDLCYRGSNDLSPPQDHLIKDQPRTAAFERDVSGRGSIPRNTAEVEPIIPDRSVFEDDEGQGRWGRVAAVLHPPNGTRRAPRKRLRSRMSKFFKCLSCCSTDHEI